MKRLTKEVDYCKHLFSTASRKDVLEIIQNSCLTDKERDIIYSRFIQGLNIKEMCEKYSVEESAYKQNQKKILIKLYNFITLA
jgi:DNA-directed RNA polymerase specialized sigma subunit